MILFFLVLFSAWAEAGVHGPIVVSGRDRVQLLFKSEQGKLSLPSIRVKDSNVQLRFNHSLLNENEKELSLRAPHHLLRWVQASHTPEGQTVVDLNVQGGADQLAERVQMSKSNEGVVVQIDPPKNKAGTLSLLKEEQQPLVFSESDKAANKKEFSVAAQIAVAVLLICLAAVGIGFLIRTLKIKTSKLGSRGYLIEQLSYCSLGNKTGVALLKVGNEFVLVGITPHQVNHISSMGDLKKRYEEESKYERDSFENAVAEEYSKLSKSKVRQGTA